MTHRLAAISLIFIAFAGPPASSQVTSFNSRSGAVSLLKSDVISALSYTPAQSGANSDITSLANVAGLPNLSSSVQGTGRPGLDQAHWFIFNAPTVSDGIPTLEVQRQVRSGSGYSGGVYDAIHGYCSTNPLNMGFEWCILGQLDNNALAFTGAQNVATQGTANKVLTSVPAYPTLTTSGNGSIATVTFSGGQNLGIGTTVVISGVRPSGYNGTHVVSASAAGSVSFSSATTGNQTTAGSIKDISIGPTWGSDDVCVDMTGEDNPPASCIGNEIDINIQSPTPTTDINRQRVGAQISAVSSSAGTHVGFGVFETTDDNTTIDRAWETLGNFNIGFDSTNGVYSTAPIFLAPNQKIVLDGDPSGSYSRYLMFSDGVLYYITPGGVVSITDVGIIAAKGFTAGSASGVSCNGVPSANFSSTNGIVTHC